MIQALGENIILTEETTETTPSGLVIPATAQEPVGVVVNCGALSEVDLAPGTRVLFRQGAGFPVKVNGKNYLVINKAALLAAFIADEEENDFIED